MNYFDDYYSPEEPQQEAAYIAPEESKPARKKGNSRKVLAVILAAALVLGSSGLTALFMSLHWNRQMELTVKRMEEKLAAQSEANRPGTASADEAEGMPVSGENMTPSQVYKQVVSSVVAITAYLDQTQAGISAVATGSGFLISADGYVVTNYHVIAGSSQVVFSTHDGEEHEAEVVGYEADNDLALLKAVEGEDFPYAALGSSAALEVGDQVVAIGNALSTLEFSLTSGYVSGIDRTVSTDGVAMNMIQTDVAINSGNSGGPLFNMKGEVVGITTAKFSGVSSTGVGIEGITFAIPMDDVIGMIRDLQTLGYIPGTYMGVMVLDVDSTAQFYGLPAGAYVDSVEAGKPAQKAGIQAQDIITEVGGYPVTSVSDLTRTLRRFTAGDTISVVVYRSGQYKTLEITLEEKPRTEQTATEPQVQTPASPAMPMPEAEDFSDWFDIFQDFFG